MGFALREGRFLVAADARRAERVCVVDEDFARRNFSPGRALGQRLFMGGREGPDAEAFTVVGVVGPVKQAALTDDGAQGAVFYPYPYRGDLDLFVVARTRLEPESLAGTLQRVVRSVDGEVPVADVRSMEGRIGDSLLVRRSPALLAALFSGHRAAAHRDRHLRRAELCGCATPARDRCANRARSPSRAGAIAVRRAGAAPALAPERCSASPARG